MLVNLKTKFFRSAADVELDFSPGLVVMRGKSEAGKSTRLEAICYALFGAKALKQPLADVVTWGQDEKHLRVEATFLVQGRNVKFIRHKGGAEVYMDDATTPYVTGQNEVSQFASEMMGCDMQTATNLMLASQGKLRGALEGKAADAVAMIESLADFDLFETLLERMSSELVLGKDTTVKERLERAEAALNQPGVAKPDHSERLALIDSATAKSKDLEAGIEKAEKDLNAASVAVQVHKQTLKSYRDLQDSAWKLDTRLSTAKDALAKAADAADVVVDLQRMKTLQGYLDDAASVTMALVAYKAFNNLPAPEDIWEGDMDSLRAEIAKVRGVVDAQRAKLSDLTYAAKLSRSKIITSMVCPTCNQPLKDHEKIREDNKKHEADAARAEDEIRTLRDDLSDSSEELKTLEAVAASSTVVQNFIAQHHAHVEISIDTVPPGVKWKGEVPKDVDVSELAGELSDLKRREKVVNEAKASLPSLTEAVEQAQADYNSAQAALDGATEPKGLDDLRDAEVKADQALTALRYQFKDLQKVIVQTQAEITALDAQWQASLRERENLQRERDEAKQELETLTFNNNLFKKVRSARPQVADKLWALVLGAVSTMFTQMRGEPSSVTKGKDGFLVNGKPVAGLSGSTLDALGLAIRVALIRTFIPHCPFLTLDEPFSAADSDRAGKMLGFIRAAGFPQTIIVTHEDTSEQSCDQYLEI